ncbi:DivIVA domain-containing protein [Micrococcus terreus]|uniref:DivIVA domain-containing protein n=1 Tax=Micrococcus terreus TaxID=574650 RepID=UPI0033F58B88
MALTPEDVVNKRFQPTKFREGYDQDEVDDFLDEIVVELRRLNQENDELRRKVAQLQDGGTTETAVPAPVSADGQDLSVVEADEDATTAIPAEPVSADHAEDEGTRATSEIQDDELRAEDETATPAAFAETDSEVQAPVEATSSQPVITESSQSAAAVLAMAQRLHDEYVAEGQRKRDEIIAEAQTEATGLVNDAQETSRKTLAELEEKKTVLERTVDQLQGFERDYRSRLKAYIEGQLRDLDSQTTIQEETAVKKA